MCWTCGEGTWEEAQRKGSFTKAFIDLQKQEFPQIEFVKCVFVGKKHTCVLWEEAQSKGSFTKAFIDLHKQEFPQIEFVKCVCVGKKHTYVSTRRKRSCVGTGPLQTETTIVPMCML